MRSPYDKFRDHIIEVRQTLQESLPMLPNEIIEEILKFALHKSPIKTYNRCVARISSAWYKMKYNLIKEISVVYEILNLQGQVTRTFTVKRRDDEAHKKLWEGYLQIKCNRKQLLL